MPFPSPKLLRALAGVLSVVLLVGAVGTAIAAVAVTAAPAWALVAFECCVMLAGVVGVLAWRGRFADHLGMAIACVAAVALAASLFGWIGANKALVLPGDRRFSLNAWLLARAILSAMLLGVAGSACLGTNAHAWRSAGRSLVLSAIAAALALLAWKGPLASWLAGAGEWLRLGVLGAIVVACAVLACLAGHHAIRAFEMGTGFRPVPTSSA